MLYALRPFNLGSKTRNHSAIGIKPSCLQHKKISKALFVLATLTDLTTAIAVVYKSHTLSTSFNQRHVLVVSNSISLFCLEGRIYVR